MSEKLTPRHEQHETPNDNEIDKQLENIGEKLAAAAEQEAAERDQSKEAEEARRSAEKYALKSKEQASNDGEKKSSGEPVTRGHKKQTYRATMKRVESRLPTYQRVFSRFINNDIVDKASAVGARTVARPSGLLGSALTAFFGLLVASYYANRLGFEIPPALFVILLGIGWAAGILIEMAWSAVKKLRR